MRKSYSIFILSIVLAAGSMFPSCTKDHDGGKTDTGMGEGKRSLAVDVSIDGLKATRANTPSTGLAEESRIRSLNVVFYNSAGLAEYSDYYSLYYDEWNDAWNIYPHDGNISTLTYEGPDKPIKLFFSGLENKAYKLLVAANTDNLRDLYTDYDFITSYYDAVRQTGHSMDIFSKPVNFLSAYLWDADPTPSNHTDMLASLYGWFGGYNYNTSSAWNCLVGYYYEYNQIDDKEHFKDWVEGSVYLLMLNADGLFDVTQDKLFAKPEDAENNPIQLNIERAVAKVAVFDQLPDLLHNDATVNGEIHWAADIQSTKTYLLRQKAPLGGDRGAELPGSSRMYRYALDPNYDGVSGERTGGSSPAEAAKNFARLSPEGISAGEYDNLWFRQANPKIEDPMDDAHGWSYWDYLTENTMEADEQYEDVTTRLVLRLNYVPGDRQVITPASGTGGTIAGDASYYSYKNKLVFTVADMNAMAAAADIDQEIEDTKDAITGSDAEKIKGLLDELKALLTDSEVKTRFGNFTGTPAAAVSYDGLNFHLNGMCYYYVPIRHFDDTIENTPMAYGRYGVVRNNVYKIVLSNITGPGSAIVPDPKGPDDKEPVVRSSVYVSDWDAKTLELD